MTKPPAEHVEDLLAAWPEGDRQTLDSLVPLLYEQLRRLARRRLQREQPDHTLQTTALVHEVYLRFAGQDQGTWQNRAQFFAVAARMMRRILVDYARRRRSSKRGGGALRVTLSAIDDSPAAAAETASEVLELHAALEELAGIDPRKGRLVELRFFGGLSIEETAEVLEVSPGTVMRDWTLAKAWLKRRLAS